MANLTITESNVKPANDQARVLAVTYGETVLKGETVYKSSTDDLYYKGDADAANTARVSGIAILGGTVNETGVIVASGRISLGSVMTAGVTYYQSTTSGKIAPRADLASGDLVTIIGTAATSSVLQVRIDPTGIVIP